MPMTHEYSTIEPTRNEITGLSGTTLLEFGTGWCGHCQAAQRLLAEALVDQDELRHIKIEDGKGRPLGRSFRVTLWPTLIALRDGVEVGRVVRPTDTHAIRQLLQTLERP